MAKEKLVFVMIDYSNFKIWLMERSTYSIRTISNIISRLKRADAILPFYENESYTDELNRNGDFKEISPSVRSQIKKAVGLYFDYLNAGHAKRDSYGDKGNLKVLSLFSNIGVAEAYLDSIGVNVVAANELIERRAALYSKIYPETHMICGDITLPEVKDSIAAYCEDIGVDVIMATPPCQGMSTAGQQMSNDIRNSLICEVVELVERIRPAYVFIENVPLFYDTRINVNGRSVLIMSYIRERLEAMYKIAPYVIDTKDYSVPQTRERAIVLMSRLNEKEWVIPDKDEKIVTMRDAIGDLPKLDPFVKDVSKEEMDEMFPHFEERRKEALAISPWHIPPAHVKRQVVVMQHTATGCSAFDNPVYFPVKENGEAVRGYRNTYKRQNWDMPAYTVTMDNRKISSQNNVHPGRAEYEEENGETVYSDARALTLYELMKIMSIPDDWPVPKDTSEAFLRRIIGEGIPPLFVKKVFEKLLGEDDEK